MNYKLFRSIYKPLQYLSCYFNYVCWFINNAFSYYKAQLLEMNSVQGGAPPVIS